MPQFIMPPASTEESAPFARLDAFTQGYVGAMFFSECHADNPELEHASFGDLAPETLDRITRDCAKFQADNAPQLERAYESTGTGYDAAQAGRDYWFSRNGHGVGFWDRDLGTVGDDLHQACQHGSVELYLGDDGRLYLA